MKVIYIVIKEGDTLFQLYVLHGVYLACSAWVIFVLSSSIYSFVFVKGCSGHVNVYANGPLS